MILPIHTMPIFLLLVITFVLVVISIELGFKTGTVIRKKREVESESTISSISGYILALLAFIIAFTFGIVTDRYQTRRDLVREEANLIRTAWSRADFLPDTDQVEAKKLIKEYTSSRLAAVSSTDINQVKAAIKRAADIQKHLWDMAVVNAQKDMNSDVAALYIESLNDVANVNASRVVIGLHTKIPEGIWEVLLLLILFAMFSVGYQIAIVGSKRSWATLILAFSFSLVIIMIETLDRSYTSLIPVSQFPLENLLKEMNGLENIN